MYKRYITQKIIESLEESPVVLLNGARQTGKSTLAKSLISEPTSYYTLDDLTILGAIKSDAYHFLKAQKKPIVLDEIQRAPELFVSLKRVVDEHREPGKFLLTGSANILMLPNLSESLAGRMEIHTLWPLSSTEITDSPIDLILALSQEDFSSLTSRNLDIFLGGFPDVLKRASEEKRQNWFKSYLQTLLTKDIRDLSHIEKITETPKILHLLAARAGSLLNCSELSRSCGIPNTSLKRYLALLETLYLYFTIPPWSTNLSKRFVKSPKLYISDCGVLAHLVGINKNHVRKDLFGHFVENYVAVELKKHQTWSSIPFELYHYRTQDGEEIDFILETYQGDLIAIEIKSNSVLDQKSYRTIKKLQEDLPSRRIKGFVFYSGDKVVPLARNIWAVPLTFFMG